MTKADARRELFARDGYFIVRDLLSATQQQQLTAATATAIVQRIEPIAFESEIHDTENLVPAIYKDETGHVFRRLNRVLDRGGIFEQVICGPLARVAAEFLGTPLSVALNRHNMLMLKAPGNPAPVVWHQDSALWDEGTADHLSAIIALDDFLPDNGPLEIVPGSHRLGAVAWGAQNSAAIQDKCADLIARDAITVDLKAGDALFFHGLLLHGSGPNRSAAPRRSLTVAFFPGDLREVSTKSGSARPEVRILS